MKVGELQELLSGMHPEEEVKITYITDGAVAIRGYSERESRKHGCCVLKIVLPYQDDVVQYDIPQSGTYKDTTSIYGKKLGRPRTLTPEQRAERIKEKDRYKSRKRTLARINIKRMENGLVGWTKVEIEDMARRNRIQYYYTQEELAAMKLKPKTKKCQLGRPKKTQDE